MIYLASYRGSGRVSDRVIKLVTRSNFSHCELIAPDGLAWSSSGRDGGVRVKKISWQMGHWDFVGIPWAPADTFERLERLIGCRYDFAGLVLSQLLNIRRHDPQKWFCSEFCGYGLGLSRPHELSPGALRSRVMDMNRAYYRTGKPPEG